MKLFVDDDSLYWVKWRFCNPQARYLPFATPYASDVWTSNDDPPNFVGPRGKRQWIKDQLSDEAGQNFVGDPEFWREGFPVAVLTQSSSGNCTPIKETTLPFVLDLGVDVSSVRFVLDVLGGKGGVRGEGEELVLDQLGGEGGIAEASVTYLRSVSDVVGGEGGVLEAILSGLLLADVGGGEGGITEVVASGSSSTSVLGGEGGVTDSVVSRFVVSDVVGGEGGVTGHEVNGYLPAVEKVGLSFGIRETVTHH